MASWLINGLTAGAALGLKLERDTTWKMNVSTRQTVIELAGQHGNLNPGLPIFESSTVSMQALVMAASEAAVEEAVSHFTALCASPTLTLTRTSDGVTATAAAKLVSISPSDWHPDAWMCRITALFAIPGVFLRGDVWTSDVLAANWDLTGVELTGLSGSTAPVGDAILRVTGPCTNPYVSDPTSGTGLQYTGTVSAGQYLFMSARPLRARLSSSSTDWASGGTDVSAALTYPAAGRLQLWPAVQSATVRKVLFSWTGSGRTTATKLTVRAQGAYL